MPEPAPFSAGRPRAMGRGLAAILSTDGRDTEGLRELPVELVRPNGRQPRRIFDDEALLGLADSIRARGILQPIVVRPLAGGHYELIAGERRLRAARLADLQVVPAIVRETADDERLELALIENTARADLNPVEEARALATLVDDLGLTKEEVGRRLGRSRAAVSNLIRLLDLPDEVLEIIEAGRLSEGHGRAVLMCHDHAARRRLARAAADAGWSVRETERRARLVEDRPRPMGAPVQLHPDLADALGAAEDALTAALGHPVKVSSRGGACRVELVLESPRDAVEMADRILHRRAA